MKRTRGLLALAGVAAVVAACETDPADRILRIEETGTVNGVLFLDNNHSGTYEPAVDQPLRGALVAIRRPGSPVDLDTESSDSLGRFHFTMPIGHYQIGVPAGTLGDSLEVVQLQAAFTLAAKDTVTIGVPLRFPARPPDEVRALPLGTKVWLRGVALNSPLAFGDSTVHVAENGVAIRVTGVRLAPIFPGDSLFFLGTRSTRAGQPTLQAVTCHPSQPNCHVSIAGVTFIPDPVALTTAAAADAAGGAQDANLVRIAGATISDTTADALGTTRTLTVDDGSGPVQVILSATVNWGPRVNYAPGVTIDVIGLLVPIGGGDWVLKPRFPADLTIVATPPTARGGGGGHTTPD